MHAPVRRFLRTVLIRVLKAYLRRGGDLLPDFVAFQTAQRDFLALWGSQMYQVAVWNESKYFA
jgi:tRNA(Met) C34 N-acetyltransferase TmcA